MVPALTVQMVVRNVGPWLPTALQSLRNQRRQDFDVVAVDDGSTDNTAAILRSATDLPILCLSSGGAGVAVGRNMAIAHARAPIIATLDGDDIWLPWYVERMLARFDTPEQVDIVSPEMFLAVDDQLTTDRYYADGHPLRWFDEDQLNNVLRMNFVAGNTAVRAEVFQAVGGYAPELTSGEDHDLWIRAFAAGFRAVQEPTPCAVYRIRHNSTTAHRSRLVGGRVRTLERAAASLPPGPAAIAAQELVHQRRQLDIAKGKEALAAGKLSAARRHFARVAASPGASPRERIGSLIPVITPTVGQRLLRRREAVPPATAAEARKARE